MRKHLLALSIIACVGCIPGSFDAEAAGYKPAPSAGNLGAMLVNPYGNSPLTAVLDLGGKKPTAVKVIIHGKGEDGVSVSYPVGQKTINTHDGIPIFGLYANYKNQVTVEYLLDGDKFSEKYEVLTGQITNHYVDNRNITLMQEVKVKTVAKGFEDRLYMVNSHTKNHQGADLHWSGQKGKKANGSDATPAMGAMPFDTAPMTYIIDTKGEIRWWLDQNAIYNAKDIDINKRGYLMGMHDNGNGQITFVQGQTYGYFDLLGKVETRRLPRGYIDATHEHKILRNGNSLIRAAKANYINQQGDTVHSVRDHILEIDPSGNLVDVWDLGKIMDPYRDSLLKAMDMGAVCVNVDINSMGNTSDMEIDAPYGDIPGVGVGRNWAHINSIEYDEKDDSIILSFRHQGVAKITRNKEVKWILAPSEGWNTELSKKLLKPIDHKGKSIKCTTKGVCEGEFDFTYTQHTAWLNSKTGTLTVFDNGDARGYEQPALPSMKYSRFVEYKINEDKMTVQQIWEYGKDRGYEWYSPITSNVEYKNDKNTMFGFNGSINLFTPGERTIGKISEIGYDDKKVKVEIDVLTDKPNSPHYRSLIVAPENLFNN